MFLLSKTKVAFILNDQRNFKVGTILVVSIDEDLIHKKTFAPIFPTLINSHPENVFLFLCDTFVV